MSTQHHLFRTILELGNLGLKQVTLQKMGQQMHSYNAVLGTYLKVVQYYYL
jgi:hypothetical protein